jgi:hypothetical protein
MQEPTRSSIDDLAQTTQLYVDIYVALELLHCSYDTYIQTVPRRERLMNQLYVMLKSAKETHAQEDMERQSAMDREAQKAMMSGRA